MEKRVKVADFAALIGVVPKTVYKMIEREEIVTVTEKVNNRNTTLIITNDEQIEELKKVYGKDTVNTGNYYENVTENNRLQPEINVHYPQEYNNSGNVTAEVIDRIMSLNEGYNEQLKEVTEKLFTANDELVKVKAQQLLLEDKAGREGFYINEINGLKTSNENLKKWLYGLITVIVLLLIGLTGYITYNITVINQQAIENEQLQSETKKTDSVQKVVEPSKPARK